VQELFSTHNTTNL